MAKQTFTTGQILTAAQMTSLQETAMGGGAATAKTTSYVLVAGDAGTTVAMNSSGATTITVNTGLFAAGDTVFIQNLGTGVCTITAGTATVNSAGSLALPQYDGGILYFTSASAAIFYDYIQAGMTSPLTTKGDLWTYTTTDARLASSGVNNDVLTVDTSTASGLKWAAPSSGALVKLASGTLSGTTISFDNIFTDQHTNYLINWNVTDTDGIQRMRFRVSGSDNTNTNYFYVSWQSGFSGTPTWGLLNNSSSADAALEMPVGSAGNRYTWSIQLRTRPVSATLNDLPKYFGTWNRGDLQSGVLFGGFSSGTDFDGFTVYNTGSTWSGTYEVYGYAL